MDNSDVINPDSWKLAFKAARSYLGMGAIYITFNPYVHSWQVKIDFCSGVSYNVENEDVNKALEECAAAVHTSPPQY